MPLNSLLGVAILFAEQVLYPHYATTATAWGPTPLEDQQLAGAIMWGVGDAGFLVAILGSPRWMRDEEATTAPGPAAQDAIAAGRGRVRENGSPSGWPERAASSAASASRRGVARGGHRGRVGRQADGIGASR